MKKYSVVWAREAVDDVKNLIDYLTKHNSNSAEKIFEAIVAKTDSLASQPERGRKVPELAGLTELKIREIFYKPWRLIYRVSENEVRVLMLVDGRRSLEDELLRTLLIE